MRILITGAAGFIGSAVTVEAYNRGWDVFGVDDGSTASNMNTIGRLLGNKLLTCDLTKVRLSDVDCVIHLAAKTMVVESEGNKTLYAEMNIAKTMQLLDNYPRAKIIFASTSDVYKPTRSKARHDMLVSADSEIAPNSWYGKTKLAAELYIRATRSDSVVLRLMNVCGATATRVGWLGDTKYQEVLPIFIRSALQGKPLQVFSTDGLEASPVRDFVHVADVARAFCDAADSEYNGVHVVGTGLGTSVGELAGLVRDKCSLPVLVDCIGSRSIDYPGMVADSKSFPPYWSPQCSAGQAVVDTLILQEYMRRSDL